MQCKMRFEGGAQSAAAAGLLGQMCTVYCANHKGLFWAAKSHYAGPMVVNAVQGSLPAHDSFKVGAGGLVGCSWELVKAAGP